MSYCPLAQTAKITNQVILVGSGCAYPNQRLTNTQLGLRVDTNDSWIRSRTGIGARRIIGPGETLTDLSYKAASAAIEMAGWDPQSIDLVLLATSTPDDLFGSAPAVQTKLNANNSVAFDLTAACSGFLFALITASQFLRTGSMRRALVIGADQLSSWVNWDDRRTCVLFGDGAGAVAIEAKETSEKGLIDFELRSDGRRGNYLNLNKTKDFSHLIENSSYQTGSFSPIEMNGQEVYKFAVKEVPAILQTLLRKTNTDPQMLDWLLLHQANQRILNAVADRFKISYEKVLTNLADYGNTSAATIPIMLDEAIRSGRVKPGDLIASSGFGAGLSWGAALFRWHGPN